MNKLSDIGLIGLAVMGENLVLNMESKGFRVTVFNRTTQKVDDFLAGRAKNKNIAGAHSIEDLVASLARPRKIMLMIKAGSAVDEMIETLIPHLDKGDIIIDGGSGQSLIELKKELLPINNFSTYKSIQRFSSFAMVLFQITTLAFSSF